MQRLSFKWMLVLSIFFFSSCFSDKSKETLDTQVSCSETVSLEVKLEHKQGVHSMKGTILVESNDNIDHVVITCSDPMGGKSESYQEEFNKNLLEEWKIFNFSDQSGTKKFYSIIPVQFNQLSTDYEINVESYCENNSLLNSSTLNYSSPTLCECWGKWDQGYFVFFDTAMRVNGDTLTNTISESQFDIQIPISLQNTNKPYLIFNPVKELDKMEIVLVDKNSKTYQKKIELEMVTTNEPLNSLSGHINLHDLLNMTETELKRIAPIRMQLEIQPCEDRFIWNSRVFYYNP